MITIEKVVRTLAEIVEDFPDRQAACWYRKDGEPMCIVGEFAFRVGGKKALVALREGFSITDIVNIRAMNDALGGFEEGAFNVLGEAQAISDHGYKWNRVEEEVVQPWKTTLQDA